MTGEAVVRQESTERVALYVSEAADHLVALAYVLTGSRSDAQDVAHDVVVRLLERNPSTVRDLDAYARRAVVNECTSRGRRMGRSISREQRLRLEWNRVLATQPDPYGRLDVMAALARLGGRQRSAVVLRYYLDWTDHDIADALGCAPATVRSLLSRAMKKLRAELDGGADDE